MTVCSSLATKQWYSRTDNFNLAAQPCVALLQLNVVAGMLNAAYISPFTSSAVYSDNWH